jgi:heme a synthase
MKTAYHPGVHRYAVLVFAWTLLLLLAGALVTSKDAALAVADWPTSFGTYFPSLKLLSGGAFFEHAHRVIAFILGLLLLAEAILIWFVEERRWLRWFALAAVGGVVAQAVLGGEVVRKLLHYWLPVAHACFAQIMFGAILSIAVFTSKWWTGPREPLEDQGGVSIHTLAVINAAMMFVQVFLGAGFRHQYTPIWPHIVGAVIAVETMMRVASALRKRFPASRELDFGRKLLHATVGTQLLLGGLAYWSRLATRDAPQPMPSMVLFTVIHTVFGALVFASSILVVLMCYRLVARRGAVAIPSASQTAIE